MPSVSDEVSKLIEQGQQKKISTQSIVGIFTQNRWESIDPLGVGETAFDLSSLTKVLATTTLVAKATQVGKFNVDQPLDQAFGEIFNYFQVNHKKAWLENFKPYTWTHVLGHCAQLPWRINFFDHFESFEAKLTNQLRQKIIQKSLELLVHQPLEHATDRKIVYSDPGFQLLGLYLEVLYQKRLKEIFDSELPPEYSEKLSFEPTKFSKIAPTEECPWRKRRLQGEVHDENASLWGGDAGHAGLFGTISGCQKIFTAWFPQQKSFLTEATKAQFCSGPVVGKTDGLYAFRKGWDTPLSLIKSGWSESSFGHWGFTGVGAWFDPERQWGMILLSNQVYFGRDKTQYRAWRDELFTRQKN